MSRAPRPGPRSLIGWLLALCALAGGCARSGSGAADLVWGGPGLQTGQFVRPRGIAISRSPSAEEVYVVDFAGRIQVFSLDGEYRREWRTPSIVNGRPGGISIAPSGEVIVPDSHYQRILIYSPQGRLLREIVGTTEHGGLGPFAYLSDVVQSPDGCFFVAEFGDDARIRKLDSQGRHLTAFGSSGSGPGQLARPRGLALGPAGEVVVADSCNHRLQIFAPDGRFLRSIGHAGQGPGEFNYPYKVAVAANGDLFVAEFGNHRVQRLNWSGQPIALWGRVGRGPGCLAQPWGVAVDAAGRVYVADTENHRIQRVRF